ncbi:glycosyltransferase family 1 protein [Gracilibacillus sp. YIM 98692]|uniref:glycosyltransferase family 1 protein n=1 Tax=Gracilibacillus sp. YIM 98692 TaxID=2663532 RepID=UPI0013D2264F|nr:glycosyltransferase family 1 protein [Gracilibacillus sp. YIM 98692]
MKPIRVLQVFGQMNRAGAETFIMNVYRNIDRSKIQFDFLVYKEEPGNYDLEIQQLGGKLYRIAPIHPRTYFNFKKDLKHFFNVHTEYKIVHSHIDSLSTLPLKAAKKAGLPFRIAHSHTTRVPKNVKSLYKLASKQSINKHCTHRFACSKQALVWLFGSKYTGLDNSKIIKNGIDVDKFLFNRDIRNKTRKLLNLEGKFVIGSVGKFTKTKNHTFLIDVFNDIQKKDKNAVLILIGTGNRKKMLQNKISKLNIEEKVKFLGNRNDVNDLMQAMDALIHPSLYEGLPLTLIEAQTSGLPCMVSRTVSNEVKITNLVNFLDLNDSTSKWSDMVLSKKNYKRDYMKDIIQASGFDTKNISKDLEEFYMNLSEKI